MKQIILMTGFIFLAAATAVAQSGRVSRTNSRVHSSGARHRSSHHGRHHKPTYYYDHREGSNTDARTPSPYKGDNTPSNDGAKRNERRNLNSNSGQPLPSNSGR